MATRDAVIRLLLDNRKYDKNVKQSETRSQKMFKAIKAGSLIVVAAFTAMTVAALAYGRKAFGAFKQQEQAENRLKAALKSTGREYTINSALIKSYASDLQRATTIGDETAIAMAAVGITMNDIATEDVPLYLSAISNYATATARANGTTRDLGMISKRVSGWLNDLGGDVSTLEKEIRGWTESESEHVKALVEAGKAAEARIYVLKRMDDSYKGMAASTRESVGIVDALKNATGDLDEKIFQLVWDRIYPYIKSLTLWFEEEKNVNRVLARTDEILGYVETTLKGIKWTVEALYSASGIPALLRAWNYFTHISTVGTAVLAIELNKVYAGLLKMADLVPGIDLSEKIEEARAATERWRQLLEEYRSPTAMAVTVTASEPSADGGGGGGGDGDATTAGTDKDRIKYTDEQWEEKMAILRARLEGEAALENQHRMKMFQNTKKVADLEKKISNEKSKAKLTNLKRELAETKLAGKQELKEYQEKVAAKEKANREANINMAANNAKLLATSVMGSERASKVIAGIEAAQALRKLKQDLATLPGQTFGKTMSQMGFWGWASAIAASAAVAMQIRSAFSGVRKFREGGIIPGNPLRGDSVPIWAQPGEVMIPQKVVSAIKNGETEDRPIVLRVDFTDDRFRELVNFSLVEGENVNII